MDSLRVKLSEERGSNADAENLALSFPQQGIREQLLLLIL